MGGGASGAAVGVVSVLADTAGTPATALSVGTAGFVPGDFVAGVMTPVARAGFSGAGVALTGGALVGGEATFVAGATTAAAGTGISGSGAALTGGVSAGDGATTADAACGTAEGPADIESHACHDRQQSRDSQRQHRGFRAFGRNLHAPAL